MESERRTLIPLDVFSWSLRRQLKHKCMQSCQESYGTSKNQKTEIVALAKSEDLTIQIKLKYAHARTHARTHTHTNFAFKFKP